MGAESSVQREGKSQEEDASAAASGGELSAELEVLREEGGGGLDCKPLQKNGQISSMSSLNGHSEDKTLAEVGQPDAVSVPQKEETSETVNTSQDEVVPQVNGEKVEKESPDANDISAVEEKAGEEKPDDATEVGFKKIFRFVGFKFTLKKDKSEEKEPVKLLTVKDKDGEELSGTDEPTKEEEAVTAEEKSTAEEKEAEATPVEAELTEDKTETTGAPAEDAANGDTDESVKEGEASPLSQETTLTLSPFRKLFGGGIFSNLRKKASIKKTKEDEDKEAVVEEEAAKSEETVAAEEDKVDAEQENQEAPATPGEEKSEPKEEAAVTPDSVKSEATPTSEETPASSVATSDETKQDEEKAAEEKAPAEVTSEVELLSSQEKAKPQGSPLKKLFTGAGLKKLSTKKQKTKKDTESKLTESGEQAAEQLQSSTESAEAPKADSGPSSPEESGEHVLAVEVTQNESNQEADVEVASDGEKKKEGIIAWSSFKRLVTPKKLVKRSSESDDEATGEKPANSATLSSSESAPLADKSVEEEATEEKPTEEEPRTENTEKLVSSTEEPKKKMDTSVSWEALMCMGGTKKRTRRTSDSDDEETKIEEEAAAVESVAEEEQEVKPEAALVTLASQNTESEGEGEVVSSPEPLSPPERESTWDTLKRMVMSKSKPKVEEKPEESANQVQSDSEAPKEESSFSLRKFFPGRKKKKVEKQASTEAGEEDSDTPAVVPLSEYDDQVEAKQEVPAEIQIKVSTEDRSPSWIPASVEDADNNHDQLSDIPEEAENAATPKSVDTDIADDEDQAMQTNKGLGRRLSTAEMKPVAQAPAAEATLVPQGPTSGNAEEVVAGIEAQISEIPSQTSVTVVDVPLEAASENTEDEPPTGNAEVTSNTILQPHTPEEAMSICTGLGTKEIAKVALEKPATPLVECMAVVRDALGTEVLMEDKPASPEQGIVAEETVFIAQVHQVETTDLEPAVENSLDDVTDIQAATESREPEIEKIGVVTTLLEESVVLQTTTVSENSPKAEIVNPITPTSETAICTQSVEVIEPTVETKGEKIDMEPLDVATEENAPITEVIQVVDEEISSTMYCTTMTTITKETVVLSCEEAPVITETVVGIAPLSLESDQVASSEGITIKEEDTVVETVEATAVEILEPESPAVSEQATEKIEEIHEVQQACEIEAQSQVIAQTILQDAMDKVSETTPEPQKPATTPSPVQATAGTEEEIITDNIVITDTPVAVICDKPVPKSPPQLHVAMEVIDTFALEVTESLDASVEEEKKEAPVEELKQAVEVKVSEEETVVVEEVVEGVAEVEKEQSKEEEVKPQSEESEKNKETEIHMPVQVVLQTAHLVEESLVEEEVVVEFDSNGPMNDSTSVEPTSPTSIKKLSTLSEEAQATASGEVTEAAADQPETEKTTSGKCAEVMAQVMEVIEEAVKEIEPVSTEITATS
nr:PREDICTED: A-kinase anchor protein 12 isoform X1 [Paralichthys olivaceus]